MFKKRFILLFATMVGVLLNAASSQDQKAVEILESMQDRYEQSIEDVDDYVMEKDNHTIFYKKVFTEDGRPFFKTKTKGNYKDDMESASATNKDIYSELSSKAKAKATYEGTDEVDGHEVHVIYIDQMELEGFNANKDTKDTVENIYLYIDSDKLVVRRMEYTVKSKVKGGEMREISPVITNRDFRNVEGMLIPYESATVVKGLTLSDEEREKAEKGLREIEEKMEKMPESRREMIKDMAGDKIEKYRKMVEEDQYKEVSRVKNIEVNTGMKMEEF